jgi:apolipoprotein N-acyltransferase
VLPIAQLASVLGVFGVSGLVAAVNAALAVAVTRRRAGARAYVPMVAVGVLVAAVAAWGARRVARADWTMSGPAIRVGLVQANVNQAEKWDARRAATIFADHVNMTKQAIADGAELVVWPESSTPFYFDEQRDRASADRIRQMANEASVPILVGSVQIERGQPDRYYNAAFLVGPDGKTDGVYRKIHLVPFGEYVPFRRLLFFAAPLVENVGELTAGREALVMPVRGRTISTAICYEVVYPHLVRRFVQNGSELLTTITNDAWFGTTSAPYQHFAQASMRAIENGRYLVRAANTGISGVVDPAGRVLAESRLSEPAVIGHEVRFLNTTTIYTSIGDLFAYLSALVTVLLLLQSRLWRLSTT